MKLLALLMTEAVATYLSCLLLERCELFNRAGKITLKSIRRRSCCIKRVTLLEQASQLREVVCRPQTRSPCLA